MCQIIILVLNKCTYFICKLEVPRALVFFCHYFSNIERSDYLFKCYFSFTIFISFVRIRIIRISKGKSVINICNRKLLSFSLLHLIVSFWYINSGKIRWWSLIAFFLNNICMYFSKIIILTMKLITDTNRYSADDIYYHHFAYGILLGCLIIIYLIYP